jgi:hypothetical protein
MSLLASVLLFIVVLVAAYLVYTYTGKKRSGYTFKGINSACPCEPNQLLKSGLTGGLLMDDIGSNTMMISMYNNCDKTMYVVGTLENGGRQKFIDVEIPSKTLLRQGLTLPQINAGAVWASTDTNAFTGLRADPKSEPDPTAVLKIECTIVKNGDTWTNGGNISYVEGVTIPALLYFGPGRLQGVDDNPEDNNKLCYTTCTQKQLQQDCPTFVDEHGTCLAPDYFCMTKYNKEPNWRDVCDDANGDMSVYIKAFQLDKVNSSLYRNPDDQTSSTLSRFIYNNGNPFKYGGTPYQLGNYYWPTPDKTASPYTFTDEEEKNMFVGTVANGKIVGGPDSINPAPTGKRITAFNSVMNGWAIARGMCDPNDVLNNCGGQGGDYMARYTSTQTDLNNFTKGDTNLATNVSSWHTGKFPDNRFARYVTEHTHLIYGFPYDEGKYGGYSSCNPKDKPQVCVVFCPECKLVDEMIT